MTDANRKFHLFERFSIGLFLLTAVVLAAVMSLTSGYNRHPDESNHFEAAKYYENHFLPPEIGDPSVLDSYSVWGVSYLNYHWIEYFLAGKFVSILTFFGSNELFAARFFNVFLFFSLSIFFLYRSRANSEILVIPSFMLITPQVWYVFSYINNDAFALFVSMLTAYLTAHRDSILHRFLAAGGPKQNLAGGIVFGALIGMLLIGKTNYFAFIIFAAGWLLYSFPIVRIAALRPA